VVDVARADAAADAEAFAWVCDVVEAFEETLEIAAACADAELLALAAAVAAALDVLDALPCAAA
jgi:hypothetical protein